MTLNDTGVFTWDAAGAVQPLGEAGRRRRPARRAARRAALAAKRLFDVLASLLLLVAAAPLLAVCALAIRLTSRGPAFFVQERIGQDCERFEMLKLRTMRSGAERDEERLGDQRGRGVFFKLADDPRVTPVGRLLRRFSLDELPQLVNVLRGDMSLVGPRPPLLSDFSRFPAEHRRCFAMRPGMTGLWQVEGRSLLPDAERIRLDREYVDRWSLARDLEILARTPAAVLSGRGAI